MKILMIAPTPFFADRGCHTQIYEQIKALKKLGHTIVLCTYGFGRDLGGIYIKRTINFFWYKKLSAGPSFSKIILDFFLLITTIKTIIKFRPDIIHAHLHEGAVIARICRIFFKNKKYLFDMQGSLTKELVQHGFINPKGFFYKTILFIEKRIVNWFYIITQSESMVLQLKKMGKSKDFISNVYDGVDAQMFQPMEFDKKLALKYKILEYKPRILFMGLLEKYQGIDIMMQAFVLAIKKIKDLQCIIIGYPNIEKYKAKAFELGISDNLIFLGKIKYEDLPKYLSLSDIAIAPKISQTEGDGKIYNYMAMGMAVIAFEREVSREILGDCGIYAKFNDAEDLADKIIYAQANILKCRELGSVSRQRVISKFSWDAVGMRIQEVYRRF